MAPLLEGFGSPKMEVRWLSLVPDLCGIQTGLSIGILRFSAYNLPVSGRIHMCLTWISTKVFRTKEFYPLIGHEGVRRINLMTGVTSK